jgi:1A family penicillin-binding protein
MDDMRASPRRTRVWRGVLGAGVAIVVLATAAWAWVYFAPCWLGGCAPVEEMARFQAEGSQLFDINGQAFGTLATVNRRVVPLDSMPPHLLEAFLAIEDRRFYRHSGIDWRRMAGAVRQTAGALVGAGGRVEGGSTITMQLARNLFPEQLPYTERSVRRKLMEARIARQIERSFSKDKILELYLNHIYLGSGAYGVEAAAQAYFGKPVSELDVAESAVLAALPQAPSILDPTRNQEGARQRRNVVLREMAEAGFLPREEYETLREEPIRLSEHRGDPDGPTSSYFIERVRRELEERVGSHFYTAGLRVHTTLDLEAQEAAEAELKQQLERIESGHYGHFRHERYQPGGERMADGRVAYLQGAAVLMDANTGEVRALVGGRDWNDSKFDRAVQALRQPGSAFKPFVYLAALERFRSPVDPLEDTPLRMELSAGRVWEPRNFNDQYDGLVTVREALTRSKNTATVRLAMDVGIGPAVRAARDLGISSELPEFPATALGAAEVRPLELVAAYAAFANGGSRVEPYFVRRVEDRQGRILWQSTPQRRQAIDPAAAFVLTSILQDVLDRGTATAVRGVGFRGPAAGKTGTTNDNTDVWFIGYTPELVGGIWIGFDTPRTIISGASGGRLAAPVWGRIMNRVYRNREVPSGWQRPPQVQTEEVDRSTGSVVSASCPPVGPTYTEYFVGSAPRDLCRRDPGERLAEGEIIWGDEETGLAPGTLSERGIEWPELEELLRERENDLPPLEAAELPTAEPAPDAETPRPGERVDTILPDIDESELPGVPVEPGEPRLPPAPDGE